MFKIYATFIAFIMFVILSGCATNKLKTDISFHEMAVGKSERENKDKDFNLPFDAYVIGVEKDNKSRVAEIKECTETVHRNCLNINASYYTKNKIMQNN